jgi:hypothetical protein
MPNSKSSRWAATMSILFVFIIIPPYIAVAIILGTLDEI